MAEDTEQPFVSRTSAISGMVAGLLHAGASVLLWNYFFVHIGSVLSSNLFMSAYLLIGMFALGFVPVAYSTSQKTVSPVLLTSVLLIVSVYGSWQAHPLGAPRGSPTAFGIYLFLWVGVVLLAGLASYVERKIKQRETA